MTNAKIEFLTETKKHTVIWASISFENKKTYKLLPGYTKKQYDNFLNFIDFEYDNDYSGQELCGVIMCENGVWFDRNDSDGYEWWEQHKPPKMENFLTGNEIKQYIRQMKLKRVLK